MLRIRDYRTEVFSGGGLCRRTRTYGSVGIPKNKPVRRVDAKVAGFTELEYKGHLSMDETLKTNLCGYFHMTHAAVPDLTSGSAIISAGAVTGFDGDKSLLDYSMTKGGIHAFTKSR